MQSTRSFVLLTAATLFLNGLSGCVLTEPYISRHDLVDPECALEIAKQHTPELQLILSLPREYQTLIDDKNALKAFGEAARTRLQDTPFNGLLFYHWEYSTGNLDICDDGWEFRPRTVIAPLRDTKRRFLRRTIGRYQIIDPQLDAEVYASRSISRIDGVLRYEYCYDIGGLPSDAWMRYYLIGDLITEGSS
jgi:hypothetical protein